MNKVIFITGATSGIGEATARLLSKNNFDLILCGRREARLQELKEELNKEVNVHTLNFDVRDREATFKAIQSLPDNFKKIDILINNAGNAHGMAAIQDGDLNDWEHMIDINIKGFLYVSKAVVPGMVERKAGHIVNIGSIAGKEVYPGGNVYCATKFAVDALNKGMLIDLHQHGIKVSAVNPGLVETEFSMVRFKGDEAKSKKVYEGMTPLKGEDIADIILFIITRPAHVNLNDVLVLPAAQAGATLVHRTTK
ncbi:MAG: SDR family NAD(P)-dependent oxidoreductase [Bacteroidota bacterium]|nr:SDR family NAD(P)-dependent oxidoreductase [Bacteroidota bacterium]